MIRREDFVFAVGFEGNTAVVDGALKRRYGSLSAEQLAEQGLYKQALSAAIYELQSSKAQGGEQVLERVLAIYNRDARTKISSVEELKRLFGVFEVPEGIAKVTVI
jgi:hypothetical protein